MSYPVLFPTKRSPTLTVLTRTMSCELKLKTFPSLHLWSPHICNKKDLFLKVLCHMTHTHIRFVPDFCDGQEAVTSSEGSFMLTASVGFFFRVLFINYNELLPERDGTFTTVTGFLSCMDSLMDQRFDLVLGPTLGALTCFLSCSSLMCDKL